MIVSEYKFRFYKKRELPEKYKSLPNVYDWVSTIATAFCAVAVVLVFIFRIANVNGTSMNPTLNSGDCVMISEVSQNYSDGDIIVISPTEDDHVTLIKRIIGVEGDTIDIDFSEGEVYRNGELLDEPYINEPTFRSFAGGVTFPLEIPEGYVFVMGDNRNNSLDSRSPQVGLINVDNIMGKMIFRIYENN